MIDLIFRFKDVECAKKSCELNGQDLSGSVLRVDMATATPAERDQKLAVFIGNIPFSVEDDDVRKHFECCGEVKNEDIVKLVYNNHPRDPKQVAAVDRWLLSFRSFMQ